MGLSIATNVSSLTSQRALERNGSSLATRFQRLSTGLRINSAKDDAAGLAISERFTAQIRGLNQAVRNANDAISLSQTAESALVETGNILQRIRELSVQSANDTNSASDRQAIQTEVDQLVEEMERIATETSFNGRNILDGSFSQAIFQVGANAGQTIAVTIGSARTAAMGAVASSTAVTVSATSLNSGELTINGVTIRDSAAADDTASSTLRDASAISKAAAVNASSSDTGVTATVDAAVLATGAAITAGTLDAANNIIINGVQIGDGAPNEVVVSADDADGALRDAINARQLQTGVFATLDVNNELVLTAADGRNIDLVEAGAGDTITGAVTGVTTGGLTLTSDEDFTIAGTDPAELGMVAGNVVVNSANSVANLDLTSQTGAANALAIVDTAIRQISTERADLGAIQNRLDSTISNLSTVSENLAAARSRIRDADFAFESSQLVRNQILQQASAAMLSQANVAPQIALSLLG